MGKKLLTTLALTGAMLALPATAAFAHDCFIANRSSQGSQGAGNSANATGFNHGWVTIDIAEELTNAGVSDVDAAMTEWLATGHQAFYASRVETLIGGGSSNPNLGNGKGLDHFSESPLFGDLIELIVKYGGSF